MILFSTYLGRWSVGKKVLFNNEMDAPRSGMRIQCRQFGFI